jgi:hypothetical protein
MGSLGCAISLVYYGVHGLGRHNASVRGTPPFLLWNAGPKQNLVMHVVWRLTRGIEGAVGDDA